MDRLQEVGPDKWSVPPGPGEHRAPILMYGTRRLLQGMDDQVLQQIANVATLPGLVGAAMTMPDAHWGYGFPIGGVAAFDADAGGVVSMGGVGFDISCGIRCLRTNLTVADIEPVLERLADELFSTIPAGLGGEGDIHLTTHELDRLLRDGAEWAVREGYGVRDDLVYIEEHGRVDGAEPGHVSALAKRRQLNEMGTLGSGNHYLEVQVVETIFDAPAADAFGLSQDQVVVSIHCGSRGLGHQIGTDYLVEMAQAAPRLGIHLPDRELACAPVNSPEGQRYLGAMRAGINCALANRQILTHLTRQAFNRVLPGTVVETLFDVSHNTCKAEIHPWQGEERLLYVHRKGATRAFGPGHAAIPERYREHGQPVIIGGSMGTSSYIMAGTAESEARSFSSASHGAGRALSRHQALKQWRGREVVNELRARNIVIKSHSMRGVAEEAPGAYKDVDEVAEATERASLASRVTRVLPRISIKG